MVLSDHFPVQLDLVLPLPPTRGLRPPTEPRVRRPAPKYTYSPDKVPDYRVAVDASLAATDLYQSLDACETPAHIQSAAKALISLLLDQATLAFPPSPLRKRSKSSKYDWFDDECRAARAANFKAFKTATTREEIYRIDAAYQSLLATKDRQYRAKQARDLVNLARSDPRRFYAHMKPPGRSRCKASAESLSAHFSQLYDQPPPVSDYDFSIWRQDPSFPSSNKCLEEGQAEVLLQPFAEDMIARAALALKTNKAADSDGLRAELLRSMCPGTPGAPPSLLLQVITKLFNRMFIVGFPELFAGAHLVPLYKKGDPQDPSNYRGIAIISLLAKLYATLLNQRLSPVLESAGVRASTQAGFRPQRSTTEQIWSLQHLIDLQCRILRRPDTGPRTGKPIQFGRGHLYCCFVDFAKAFDCLPRELLWRRLRALGVPDGFVRAIESYYSSVTLRVHMENDYSDPFSSTMGVKQGCPLSPTLFGVLIDHFADFISNHESRPGQLGPFALLPQVLFFADDLALIATSEKELHALLALLREFCENTCMSVNRAKTQIVIFRQDAARPKISKPFRYKGEKLDVVDEYPYLGFRFHAWKSPRDHGLPLLLSDAKRSCNWLLSRCHALGIRDIPTALHLFDLYVRPRLLYGCEMWLPYILQSQKTDLDLLGNVVEKIHFSFLRSFLHLPVSTPRACLLWELGRLPIFPFAVKRLASFLHTVSTVFDKPQTRSHGMYRYRILSAVTTHARNDIPHKRHILAFLVPPCLSCSPSHGVSTYRAPEWAATVFKSTCAAAAAMIQSDFQQAPPSASIRLFYKDLAAPTLQMSPYLKHSVASGNRDRLLRCRLGVYDLDNRRQRYQHIPREQRSSCPCCAALAVEDESHLLLHCSLYDALRLKYRMLYPRTGDDAALPIAPALSQLLNSPHFFDLGHYLFECAQMRKQCLVNGHHA
jgi:Reverse transcriptase (RNA-dependent DNA polymerase)